MPYRIPVRIMAALALSAGPAHAGEPAPGLYEIEMQMQLPALPLAMPTQVVRECATAEDIEKGRVWAPPADSPCEVGKLKMQGENVSFTFRCSVSGQTLSGTAHGTSSTTGYAMTMQGRFELPGQGESKFTQTVKARRLGACKP